MVNYVIIGMCIILPILCYITLKCDIAYYPALFYGLFFLTTCFVNMPRVRYSVFFQLCILAFLFVIILFKYNGKLCIKDYLFWKMIPFLLIFLVFYMALGLYNGHSLIQILIDSYKYLEIIVLYFLFRICWIDNDCLLKGLKSINTLMILLGIIELFTTERGGRGLNLIISFSPIIFCLGLNGYFKNYKFLVLIYFIVIVSCQTRTYIVSAFLGSLFLFLHLSKKHQKILFRYSMILGVVCLVYLLIDFDNSLLKSTLVRFTELLKGFEYSGGYRLYDYKKAWSVFLENPMIGTGFGYLKYLYMPKMGWMHWGDFIHCFYLEALFKVGICGIVYLGFFVFVYIKNIIKWMHSFKEDVFVYSVCFGGLISFLMWFLIYSFAPLSSAGSLFIGLIVASIVLSNHISQSKY